MTFNESCVAVAKQVNTQLAKLVTAPIKRIRAIDATVKYPKVYGLQSLTVELEPEIFVMASGPVLTTVAIGWPTDHTKDVDDWADDEMAVWFFNITDQIGFMPMFFPHIAKVKHAFSINLPVTVMAIKKQAHTSITKTDHANLGAMAVHAALAQMLNRGLKL